MTPLNVLNVGPYSEAELVSQGYQRRTTATEPRLSEIAEEYRRIGFDVRVVVHYAAPGECSECFDAAEQSGEIYGDVYVRSDRSRRAP